MTHSPDHAERARQMLADRGRFPSGGDVPFDVALSLIAAALRGRDRVVEALLDHLSEQITHVETRIRDGQQMGASVWRIALEDVARENRAALHDAKEVAGG